jgi:hypothetical protein
LVHPATPEINNYESQTRIDDFDGYFSANAEDQNNPLTTELDLGAAFKAIKTELVKDFKDPYSAGFEALGYEDDSESGFRICGTVNGKNSEPLQ